MGSGGGSVSGTGTFGGQPRAKELSRISTKYYEDLALSQSRMVSTSK